MIKLLGILNVITIKDINYHNPKSFCIINYKIIEKVSS